jgi:tetratricopeptide (TPR) repeat protein
VGRWCGRNRLVAGSALVAVLCLFFGLVAATVGYVRTSRALEKSEQSRRRERKAIDDWYTHMSEDTLLNQPGLQRIRKDLLLYARDNYEIFLSDSGGDKTVRDELALAHFRVGLITDEIDSSAKAMSSYEKARDMQTQLLTADPKNVERLRYLSDTLNRIGMALHKQQQLDRSLEAYRKAIDIRGRLASLTPNDRESHRMLANTYMNIGLLEVERGNYDEARRNLEQAQSIRIQSPGSGDDPKLRRDLAKGYYSLAKLAKVKFVQADKDCDLARQWCELGRQWSRQAVGLFQALAESDRADLDMHYLLAICYRMEADLDHDGSACGLESGENLKKMQEEAVKLYNNSLEILEPLAHKNPDVTEYQLALVELYIRIAKIQNEQKNLPMAIASIDQAEEILTHLTTDGGDAARYWNDFAGAWSFIGMYHTDPLRRRKALETLETWQQYLEQVAAESPGAVGVQEPLQLTRDTIEIIKKSDSETETPPP